MSRHVFEIGMRGRVGSRLEDLSRGGSRREDKPLVLEAIQIQNGRSHRQHQQQQDKRLLRTRLSEETMDAMNREWKRRYNGSSTQGFFAVAMYSSWRQKAK
jgi:hypothetical protein